jgi:hypothetical protein
VADYTTEGEQTLSSIIRKSEVHDSVQSQSLPSQANSIPMTNDQPQSNFPFETGAGVSSGTIRGL